MRPKLAYAWRSRAAQSTVEYMLLVSVMVIALWSVSQLLVPGLGQGLRSMSTDVQGMTRDGYVGGGQ